MSTAFPTKKYAPVLREVALQFYRDPALTGEELHARMSEKGIRPEHVQEATKALLHYYQIRSKGHAVAQKAIPNRDLLDVLWNAYQDHKKSNERRHDQLRGTRPTPREQPEAMPINPTQFRKPGNKMKAILSRWYDNVPAKTGEEGRVYAYLRENPTIASDVRKVVEYGRGQAERKRAAAKKKAMDALDQLGRLAAERNRVERAERPRRPIVSTPSEIAHDFHALGPKRATEIWRRKKGLPPTQSRRAVLRPRRIRKG